MGWPEETGVWDHGQVTNSNWLQVLRLLWLSLPFTAGPLLSHALQERSDAVELTGTVGLWALWGAGLVALLIPHTISLTIVRALAPAAALAAVVATITDGSAGKAIVALSISAVTAVVALSAPVGGEMVNGSSYGDERRMLLRPPASVLLGPVPVAWVLAVVPATAGVLLLAGQQWIVGSILAALAALLGWRAAKALHRLTKRWVVFVPAGMVLVDYMSLMDPVLFRRTSVTNLGPALADTTSHDLTMNAPGLALQLDLGEDAPLSFTEAATGNLAEGDTVRSLLFSPSQPGQVLAEAESRRIAV